MSKVKLATTWLDGCSGCHMSLLDIDEALLEVAGLVDFVYGPLVDIKEFPEDVDVTLVEGAVSNEEDLEKIKEIRGKTKLLISLGDCAVTSNVPAMRNPFPIKQILDRVYVENAQCNPGAPAEGLPALLRHSRPVHEIVHVDLHLPGCPPAPGLILDVIKDLLAQKAPDMGTRGKFG
jgi:NAD-reducing hydrogenase small subunit